MDHNDELKFVENVAIAGSNCRYEYSKNNCIGSQRLGDAYFAKIVEQGDFSGAVSAVYLVKYKQLETTESTSLIEFWKPVSRHWRKLLNLRHDNIIRYHQIKVTKTPFGEETNLSVELLMDYLPEGILLSDLDESFESTKRGLPVRMLLDYAWQMATGLAYLHANGISPGNMTLRNVLVSLPNSNKNVALLCDYDNTIYLRAVIALNRKKRKADPSLTATEKLMHELVAGLSNSAEDLNIQEISSVQNVLSSILPHMNDMIEMIEKESNVTQFDDSGAGVDRIHCRPGMNIIEILEAIKQINHSRIQEKWEKIFRPSPELVTKGSRIIMSLFACPAVLKLFQKVLSMPASERLRMLSNSSSVFGVMKMEEIAERILTYERLFDNKDENDDLEGDEYKAADDSIFTCRPFLDPALDHDVHNLALILHHLSYRCFDALHRSFEELSFEELSVPLLHVKLMGLKMERYQQGPGYALGFPSSVPADFAQALQECLTVYPIPTISANDLADRLMKIQDITYGKTWKYEHGDSGQQNAPSSHQVIVECIGRQWEYTYAFPDNVIGQGGFGTVYKAAVGKNEDKKLDTAAVKRIKLNNNQIKEMKKENTWNYHKELWNVLVTLCHPNVVSYYTITIKRLIQGVGIDFGMELCEDGDLATLLEQCKLGKRKLSRSLAVSYATQIANGVSFLHQNKIIHGDLKPGNILIKGEMNSRRLLIGDLDGAVQFRDHTTDPSRSLNLQFTVTYMSPELAFRKVGDKAYSVDSRTDVWSLGCIILDLVDCSFKINERHFCRVSATGKILKIKRRDYQPMPFLLKLVEGFVPYIDEKIPEHVAQTIRFCFRHFADRITSEILLKRLQDLQLDVAK